MDTEITYNDLHRLTARLDRARSLNDIQLQCQEFGKLTGFEFFNYCAVIPTALTRPDMIELSNCPDEWQALYQEKGLIKIDPTLVYAETHHTPIQWNAMVIRRNKEKNTRQYNRTAKAHGLNNGISFPLRGNVGGTAVFNLISTNTGPIPQQAIDIALTFGALFANYVHDAVLRIFDEDLLSIKKKRISLRERECLLWVAEGKTTWEIAMILKIAERTVVYHLEKIISKLDVRNRQQAVARGMMMSYISHRLDWEPPAHKKTTFIRPSAAQ